MKRCPATNCPNLINRNERYCTKHAREYETRRGTAHRRGYGHTHRQLRTRWEPLVQSGKVSCAKCGQLILPTEPWDLGHTRNRDGYTGPEHARCNRREAGKRGAKLSN